MPAALQFALSAIGDFATPEGESELRALALERGVDVVAAPGSAADAAARAYLDEGILFRDAYARLCSRTMGLFVAFVAPPERPPRPLTPAARALLRRGLAAPDGAAEVRAASIADLAEELVMVLDRPRSAEPQEPPGTPLVAAFDKGQRVLSTNAATPADQERVCALFGRALYGDERAFAPARCLSGAPLKEAGEASLRPTGVEGLAAVRLRKVVVRTADVTRLALSAEGDDLAGALSAGEPVDEMLRLGEVTHWALEFFLAGRAPFVVEVYPPNAWRLPDRRDASVVRSFLALRGFLTAESLVRRGGGAGPDARAPRGGWDVRRLFLLLQQVDSPAVFEPEARAAWGDEAVEALERAGVVRRVAAERYPCEGLQAVGCPRRVRANPGDPKRPFVAVCGRDAAACSPVPLAPRERTQLVASLLDLGRAVRRLLGLEGELAGGDASMPRTLHLGRAPREAGAPLDVLLTRAAWNAGFAGMLAERAAHARPTLVLAPTATGVRSDLVARYAGPGHMRLAFLEDMLAVRAGKLALAQGAEGLAAPAPRVLICRALTERGERALDRTAYDALRATEPPFDLRLDLIHAVHGQPVVAWRRDAEGHAERVELTRHEAEALAELIERRAPTEARELACLRAAGLHDPVRVVERARQKVDVHVSRYAWRAFVTSGGSGQERAFHFAPPAGFRYACLLPLRS
jgi:hypothetical protein